MGRIAERVDAAEYAEKLLRGEVEGVTKPAASFGVVELRALMDFIYGGPPYHDVEHIHSETGVLRREQEAMKKRMELDGIGKAREVHREAVAANRARFEGLLDG